jgi:hypothetical protein
MSDLSKLTAKSITSMVDGNYARWRRSKDDSCDTCLERERNWSKVRVA